MDQDENLLFDALMSYSNSGEKLYAISNFGSLMINKLYKKMTKEGQFEALIFTSTLSMNLFREKYGDKGFRKVEEDFLKILLISQSNNIKEFGINSNPELFQNFINSRFKFYLQELNNMSNEGYLPGKIFHLFYINPLGEIESSSDLGELLKLFLTLTKVLKWVNDRITALKDH